MIIIIITIITIIIIIVIGLDAELPGVYPLEDLVHAVGEELNEGVPGEDAHLGVCLYRIYMYIYIYIYVYTHIYIYIYICI